MYNWIRSVIGATGGGRGLAAVELGCVVCVLLLAAAGTASAGYELELARDGGSDYTIVIGADAPAQVKAVAEDFAGYFKEMTGASIPTVTDENKRVEKEILIGPSTHISELMVGIDLSRMEGEEYLITTVDSSLILTGGKRRGTPNAVYTFLDEILGCRWYAPDCTVIPKKPTLRIKSIYWKRKPSFIFRSADMAQVAHSEWSAKVRLNGFAPSVGYARYLAKATREDIIRETGIEPESLEYTRMWAKFQSDPRLDGSWIPGVGDESKTPWTPPVHVHTLEPRVPSENIGEGLLTEADMTEYPEYFALVDGKRPSKRWPKVQPCYTNPDLPMVVASRAKEWLKRNPKATYVSVSQADTDTGCECDSCKALLSTFTYTQNRMSDGKLTRPEFEVSSPRSGLIISFVNKVAREIAKDYPDVLVHTFAYNYSLYPPDGIEIEPNVVLQYQVWSPFCYYHTSSSCRFNEGFYAVWTSIQRWAQAAKHMWIWTCGDFYSLKFHPVPMRWDNWTKNLRELRDLGIEGIYSFAMGSYYAEEWMQPLRAYLIAKTMWDPDRDPWDVIEDFASGYYGPAAEIMLEYIRQTQDLACYQEGTPQPFIRKYLKEHPQDPSRFHRTCSQPDVYVKPDTLRRWEELFDMAEKKAAGDKAILKRIAVDRLSVDYPAVHYLEPDDPVRKTALRRLLRVLGQLFGEDYPVRCPDGKRRPLKEASEFLKSSKPLAMEK